MSTFPTLSKGQDSRYHKISIEDPAIRSETEGGYVLTRARYTRAPRITFTTGFTSITQADLTTLMNFYIARKGGSDSFSWTNPVTLDVYTVRFKKPIEPQYKGMGETFLWDVPDIQLEQV